MLIADFRFIFLLDRERSELAPQGNGLSALRWLNGRRQNLLTAVLLNLAPANGRKWRGIFG